VGIDRIGAYIPSLFFTFDIQAFHSLTVTILTVQSHACYVIFQGLLYWFSEGISFICIVTSFSFTIPCYISGFLELHYLSLRKVSICVNCDIHVLSWQYATGIFLVLLLQFRESLKVCMPFCRFCRSFLMLIWCLICFYTVLFPGWNRHLLSIDCS